MVKHVVTSNNAMKARHNFLPRKFAFYIKWFLNGHTTLNWRTPDMLLQYHRTMMCQVKYLFGQNTKNKAENEKQLILTFKRILNSSDTFTCWRQSKSNYWREPIINFQEIHRIYHPILSFFDNLLHVNGYLRLSIYFSNSTWNQTPKHNFF